MNARYFFCNSPQMLKERQTDGQASILFRNRQEEKQKGRSDIHTHRPSYDRRNSEEDEPSGCCLFDLWPIFPAGMNIPKAAELPRRHDPARPLPA